MLFIWGCKKHGNSVLSHRSSMHLQYEPCCWVWCQHHPLVACSPVTSRQGQEWGQGWRQFGKPAVPTAGAVKTAGHCCCSGAVGRRGSRAEAGADRGRSLQSLQSPGSSAHERNTHHHIAGLQWLKPKAIKYRHNWLSLIARFTDVAIQLHTDAHAFGTERFIHECKNSTSLSKSFSEVLRVVLVWRKIETDLSGSTRRALLSGVLILTLDTNKWAYTLVFASFLPSQHAMFTAQLATHRSCKAQAKEAHR